MKVAQFAVVLLGYPEADRESKSGAPMPTLRYEEWFQDLRLP